MLVLYMLVVRKFNALIAIMGHLRNGRHFANQVFNSAPNLYLYLCICKNLTGCAETAADRACHAATAADPATNLSPQFIELSTFKLSGRNPKKINKIQKFRKAILPYCHSTCSLNFQLSNFQDKKSKSVLKKSEFVSTIF